MSFPFIAMIVQLALALLVFLWIFQWIIIVDVILSWAPLLGYRVNIPFIRGLLDPCYAFISKRVPSSFGGLNFGPILLMLAILVLEAFIRSLAPSVSLYF